MRPRALFSLLLPTSCVDPPIPSSPSRLHCHHSRLASYCSYSLSCHLLDIHPPSRPSASPFVGPSKLISLSSILVYFALPLPMSTKLWHRKLQHHPSPLAYCTATPTHDIAPQRWWAPFGIFSLPLFPLSTLSLMLCLECIVNSAHFRLFGMDEIVFSTKRSKLYSIHFHFKHLGICTEKVAPACLLYQPIVRKRFLWLSRK